MSMPITTSVPSPEGSRRSTPGSGSVTEVSSHPCAYNDAAPNLRFVAVISSDIFVSTSLEVLRAIAEENRERIDDAAALLHPVIASGGIIHAFGTGHSRAAAMEMAGRAGGLIPTNQISLADLVLRGGEGPEALDDPLLERRRDMIPRLLRLGDVRVGDGFVIISNSGVNASIVEMASAVAALGLPIIAVTSTAHSTAVPSRHPSGNRLLDLADVVLDNGAPLGDAILDDENGTRACGISSMSSALLIQMLTAEIISRITSTGADAPVYVSANMPGGHERNLGVEAAYAGRLYRIAG